MLYDAIFQVKLSVCTYELCGFVKKIYPNANSGYLCYLWKISWQNTFIFFFSSSLFYKCSTVRTHHFKKF